MVEATIQEYNAATTAARDKRIIESSRSQDIIWSLCGRELAHRTKIFSRGKVVQNFFSVAAEYKSTSNPDPQDRR